MNIKVINWTSLRTCSTTWILVICLLASLCTPIGAASAAEGSAAYPTSPTDKMASLNLQRYGMTLVEKQFLNSDGMWTYWLKHRSGAQIVYVNSESKDMTFGIGFKTPAKDNKGANHVLEHSLLCGSVKYPSRNIQNYMSTNSTASLLNAFTAEDYTLYPITTRNQKDFENLTDVYLNAVLDPMLLKNERIFQQQGIRKEVIDGEVQYNGIVYNEIKGKTSGSGGLSNFLMNELYNDLMAGTSLNTSSGGTIEGLEQLTYQEVLDVYKTYYRPSNSLVYLSGDQDLEWTLSTLDTYFSNYISAAPSISFTHQLNETKGPVYATLNSHTTAESSGTGIVFAGPHMQDAKATFAFQALFNLALTKLEQKLETIMTVGGNAGGISTIGLILPSVKTLEQEQVIKDFMSIFQSLYKQGINAEEWNASLNNSLNNFEYRDEFARMTNVMNGYVYANDPLLYLDEKSLYEALKQPSEADYLKEIVKKYFVHNPFTSVVYVSGESQNTSNGTVPVPEKTYTDEELASIKREASAFKWWLAKPESQEVLDKNPVLALTDFQEDSIDFSVKQETTDGIVYLNTSYDKKDQFELMLGFDLRTLNEQQVPKAQLLANLFNQQMQDDQVDGVYMMVNAIDKYMDSNQYQPVLTVSIKGADSELQDKLMSVATYLKDPPFLKQEHWGTQLNKIEQAARFETMQQASILPYAVSTLSAAERYNSMAAGYGGSASMSYYQDVLTMNSSIKKRTDALKSVTAIKDIVFNRNGLIVEISGLDSQYQKVKTNLAPIINSLSQTVYPKQVTKLPDGYSSVAMLDQGRTSDVGAIYKAGDLAKAGIPYSGQVNVLVRYLQNYLASAMRDIGAYGGAIYSIGRSGIVYSGARAPSVQDVLKVFERTAKLLNSSTITQKEVNSLIIASVNEFDQQYSTEGYITGIGLQMYYSGFTIEDLRRERKEMLMTTAQELKAYAPAVERLFSQKNLFVTGNQNVIDQSNTTFENTIDITK